MEKITFKCEIITPMFLGGADGKTPELRPPSIKGALRFWWRALHGNLKLEDLKAKETEIFGGAGEGKNAQKSNIRIKVKNLEISSSNNRLPFEATQSTRDGNPITISILEYLLIGIYDFGQGFLRDYITPESKFDVELSASGKKYLDEIIPAFYAISLFGGIGAKCRNGFGSISIGVDKKMEFTVPDFNRFPDFTAFSNNSIIFETGEKFRTWNEALAEIGIAYKDSRCLLDPHYHYEQRQYIASPIIVRGQGQVSKYSRYGKPYFLNVYKEGDNFKGRILYLPSNYSFGLEKNEQKQLEERITFLNICNKLNKSLIKQGYKEVNYD